MPYFVSVVFFVSPQPPPTSPPHTLQDIPGNFGGCLQKSLHEVKRFNTLHKLPKTSTDTDLAFAHFQQSFGVPEDFSSIGWSVNSLWNVSGVLLFKNDTLETFVCSKFLVVLFFPWLRCTALFHSVLISFCIPQRNMDKQTQSCFYTTLMNQQGENKSTCHVATELFMTFTEAEFMH